MDFKNIFIMSSDLLIMLNRVEGVSPPRSLAGGEKFEYSVHMMSGKTWVSVGNKESILQEYEMLKNGLRSIGWS